MERRSNDEGSVIVEGAIATLAAVGSAARSSRSATAMV